MNKYDEKYDIRLAKYDEIDEVMEFIGTYWNENHILANDREFFEYEMVVDGQVNFVIARDRCMNRIVGIHGFIPASKDTDHLDLWGSIWKVAPDTMGLLGIELVKRVNLLTGTRNFLSIGGNPDTTVPINKSILKLDDVGKMKHFYCLSERTTYKIAQVKHYERFCENDFAPCVIELIDDSKALESKFDHSIIDKNVSPYKNMWYIRHRYFENPIYKYEVYGIKSKLNDKYEGLLVTRKQEHVDEKALRIVDYIGRFELFPQISHFLKKKLEEYEYIDMYCYGVEYEYVKQAGMVELKEDDENIIPNWFSPFEQRNIDIWVGTPHGNAIFFKADGDQDRPVWTMQ